MPGPTEPDTDARLEGVLAVMDEKLSAGDGRRAQRYLIRAYSASPGTGKCMECGELDYTHLIVDTAFAHNAGLGPKGATLTCLCGACLARLAVEMLEAVGL